MFKSAQVLQKRNARILAMGNMDDSEDSDSSDLESDIEKEVGPFDTEMPRGGASVSASTVDIAIDGKKGANTKKRGRTEASKLLVAKKRISVPKKSAGEDEIYEADDSGSESESDFEDIDSSCENESICVSNSDDEMRIETQRILKFPWKRTVRGVQKGLRLGEHQDLPVIPWPDAGILRDLANMCNGWPSFAQNTR